jgi:hypothetical protein
MTVLEGPQPKGTVTVRPVEIQGLGWCYMNRERELGLDRRETG